MVKFSRKVLCWISGSVWLAIGTWLLWLGMNFLKSAISGEYLPIPVLSFLYKITGNLELGGILLISLALIIGITKGRFVLSKSANKGVQRIYSLPDPVSILHLYPAKYYILLLSMVGLGFLARLLPLDLRGFVDVAIGAALINGSIAYFRTTCNYEKCSHSAKID